MNHLRGFVETTFLGYHVEGRLTVGLGIELASVLVHAGLIHHLEALLLGKVIKASLRGADDVPVAADHAVPASISQDGKLLAVEATAHQGTVLLVLAVGHAVVGHNGGHLSSGRVEIHAAIEERNEVSIVVVALEDVVLAGLDVVVATSLDGTGAHVVLEHGGNGLAAPTKILSRLVIAPRGLHTGAIGADEVAGERRILGLGAGKALDRGIGVEVNLRSKLDCHARIAPRATRPHARLAPEVLVHEGSKAAAGGDSYGGVWVGRVHVRDAKRALLTAALHRIDPLDVACIRILVRCQARNACHRALLDKAIIGVGGTL